ncbi:hypothetical protein Patl1_12143 [Pistacia atlantica]|uniref:Uncharacterized protein n=1 Tax=Pistacia atlantica TaxID=434234 RepID=A0ACC1A286_9ROSI|nr:hypothetical protein Patl1_12143 [Pistacia atlantica]
MAEVVKKFFIASMFMWIAPLAILFGFNHNLLPGVVAVSLKSLSSALGRLLAGVDSFTVKLIGVLAAIASKSENWGWMIGSLTLCCSVIFSSWYGSAHLSPYGLTLLSGLLAVISVNIVIAFYIYLAIKEPSDKHEPDPAFLAKAKASVSQPTGEAEVSSEASKKEK